MEWPAHSSKQGIGGTHWALIGILVLVGIVLAIRLGIALRVRSRNRRAMAEYVASC